MTKQYKIVSLAKCPLKVPRKVGEKHIFTAHGAEYQLLKHRAGVYFLAKNEKAPVRSRWGTAAQIREDLQQVCDFGSLPEAKKSYW